MDKKQIEIIILILLITFGINYSFYSYYMSPKYEALQNQKIKFDEVKLKLAQLKAKSVQLQKAKEEEERLKIELNDFDERFPKAIDTPQLIRDFYDSLQRFGLTGSEIIFGKEKNPVNILPQGDGKGNAQGNSNAQSSNNVGDISAMSITLKLSGSLNNIEDYIKNIDSITKRKLNVKAVSITLKDSGSKLSSKSPINSGAIYNAEIVFNQYLQTENINDLQKK